MAAEAHHHGPVHLDEEHWQSMAARIELEGEVLLAFVTGAAAWVAELRGPDVPPVRRIFDIGSGPGVGTCELAKRFPTAHVTAVDSSPAMLGRATQRALSLGLDGRIAVRLAELPHGLDDMGPADLIWTSMALHHIGDRVMSLRLLGDLLAPHGLIAIAERAEPMRVLPVSLDVGRPGLADRLERAEGEWFREMRAGLTDPPPSTALGDLLAAAGFEVLGSRLTRERLEAPLSDQARRFVFGHLAHQRRQLEALLDQDDLQALEVLSDADDPRGALHQSKVFLEASRHVVIARPDRGR